MPKMRKNRKKRHKTHQNALELREGATIDHPNEIKGDERDGKDDIER